jgi:hypothetical protein
MAEGNRLYNASAVKEFNGMSAPKREHLSSLALPREAPHRRPMAPLSDLAFGRYSGQHEVAAIRILALIPVVHDAVRRGL